MNPIEDERQRYYSLGASAERQRINVLLSSLRHVYMEAIASEDIEVIKEKMETRVDMIEQIESLLSSYGHAKYPHMKAKTLV